MWSGDYLFLVQNLVLKDFRIRYRNMSLGVLWSLLNPLVMMGVLAFVFSHVFVNGKIPNFPLFLLCGLVPFNFFSVAWASGTTSIVDSVGLIKRVPIPREIVPITSVLSNCVHLLIQMALLLTLVLIFGRGINREWCWLPVVWVVETIFVCGLALFFAGINVFVRDTRYVVESANTLLFWMVPIVYDFTSVPQRYAPIYELNPVAALVLSMRNILLQGKPPLPSTFLKLVLVSCVTFAIGLLTFRKLERSFYEHM
jgi:ABC-type polysaccharide/polyol phosphate export permease